MKTELPDAKEFCKKLDTELGEWWSNDYEELVKRIQEYGELCTKHGAKSIRYQAISLIDENTWMDEFTHNVVYADYLINKIQNLEP